MATTKTRDYGHNKHLLSIRLMCANQAELLDAAKNVLARFSTHFVSMAMGSNTLIAYITPLDPQLFKQREGVEFIGAMVKDCLPFTVAEVVCGSIRLHYEKGGRG